MPKATARHDPQRELPRELTAAFQSSQRASSTITAGDEHSLPLHFKNPNSNCLPNTKDPRLKRQRCLNKNHAQPQYPQTHRCHQLGFKLSQEAEATETTTCPKHAAERRHTYIGNGVKTISTIFVRLANFETWWNRLAASRPEANRPNRDTNPDRNGPERDENNRFACIRGARGLFEPIFPNARKNLHKPFAAGGRLFAHVAGPAHGQPGSCLAT